MDPDEDAPDQTRPVIAAMLKGPGPAVYSLPNCVGYVGHDATKKKAPSFLFGIRGKEENTDKLSPGPAAYNLLDRFTRFGKDGTPTYTLHYRPKDISTFVTPAPDAYHAEKAKILKQRQPPSFSFGYRTKYAMKERTPAPNSYTLPSMCGPNPIKCSLPSFSLYGRTKNGDFSEDFAKTPSPAAYKVVDVSKWRKKAPEFTMKGRTFPPGDTSQMPGPGAHSPEKVSITRNIAPRYSFGVRHSEYLAPLLHSI